MEDIGAIKLIIKNEPIALNIIHKHEGDKKGIFNETTIALLKRRTINKDIIVPKNADTELIIKASRLAKSIIQVFVAPTIRIIANSLLRSLNIEENETTNTTKDRI